MFLAAKYALFDPKTDIFGLWTNQDWDRGITSRMCGFVDFTSEVFDIDFVEPGNSRKVSFCFITNTRAVEHVTFWYCFGKATVNRTE